MARDHLQIRDQEPPAGRAGLVGTRRLWMMNKRKMSEISSSRDSINEQEQIRGKAGLSLSRFSFSLLLAIAIATQGVSGHVSHGCHMAYAQRLHPRWKKGCAPLAASY